MRRDRHADREVLRGPAKSLPRSSPPQNSSSSVGVTPAPQLRAVLAEARQQQVLGAHCAGDPDRTASWPKRRGEGAEPAGALQCHGLGVEPPGQHHASIERDQFGAVARKIGQRAHRIALGVEKAAVADLKPGHRGRQRRSRRLRNRRSFLGCFGQRHCTSNGISRLSETALSDMW